ncbi:MAG: dATP/dGTP diphosphohydrolase domain-containing protein, partial [Selenomonas noxia]
MAEQKYPQSAEPNEYRYIDFEWLDEIAEGLTAGAEKHPGETWREIPAKEHAARAARHLSMWLAGDRDDTHLINASNTDSADFLHQMLSLAGSDGNTYYLNTLTGDIYTKEFV